MSVAGLAPSAVAEHADGSSPDKAIPVTASQAMSALTADDFLAGVRADAFVVAARGSIGVQDIPGWNKIPGLKGLAKDKQISYLAATLTPYEIWKDGSVHLSAKPLDSTLFLSITLPDRDPVVLTTKLKDLNFEKGVPIRNQVLNGGQVILFSNRRAGVTGVSLTGPDAVGSINGGALLRVANVGRVTETVRNIVKWGMRGVEASEAGAAIAGAPETGGGTLLAGAAGIAATEALRSTIFNSLARADLYLGFAWRASASAGLPELMRGHVTVMAQKGELRGKWIDVDLTNIPGAFFESKIPDFEAPNRKVLLDLGMTPKAVDILSPYLAKHDVRPFLDQTAAYLNASNPDAHVPVSTTDVINWFNARAQEDPEWLKRFAAHDIGTVQPDEDGIYRTTFPIRPYSASRVAETIAQMARDAADLGHPMPKEGLPAAVVPPALAPPQPETPLAAPAPPARGTQFAVKPPHSASLQRNTDGSSPRVDFLPVGSFVKATGGQRDVGGRRWIEVTAGRNTGWVLADSLEEHRQGAQYPNGGRYDPQCEAEVKSGEAYRLTVQRGDNLWEMLRMRRLLRHLDEIVADNSHIPDVERWVRPGDHIYIKKIYYDRGRGRN
jgi:hypothetical protein